MGKENKGEINGYDVYSDAIVTTTNDDDSSDEDSDDG